MSDCRIAVVGAGSFVFGPSVLTAALCEHRLPGIELALMDPDQPMVEAMAGVGRRMAEQHGVSARVTAHTTLDTALDGADFVLCAAARQINQRFATDRAIAARLCPGHLVTEFGGVAGISYTLRQVALVQDLAAAMRRRCPTAWLLNSANPLPRVCQAAHEEGLRTAGFCSASMEAYLMLWRLLDGSPMTYADYPFDRARLRWQVTLGGLNHFCWVVGLRDRAGGQDLLPALRQRLADGASAGNPQGEAVARRTGFLLVPNDHHVHDFLVPDEHAVPRGHASHGTADLKAERLERLRAIAEGRADARSLGAQQSWERPVDVIAARLLGHTLPIHALNLVNEGQIPQLPRGVFVETAAQATPAGPVAQPLDLPEAVVPLCQRTAQVTATLVRAARTRSLAGLKDVVELDPTIVDKSAGWAAVRACLDAHADILPAYA